MILALLALTLVTAPQTNGGRGDQPPATCMAGDFFTRTGASPAPCVCGTTNTWTCITAGGEGVPVGSILLIKAGTCPSGYAEETALDGKTIIGTLAANGNVGTTGGSDSITSVLNHTHTVNVTDPGHTHVERIVNSGTAGTVGVQGASAASNASASNSPTASGTTGITATTANPAGGVASIDNRSAFVRVIACRKT